MKKQTDQKLLAGAIGGSVLVLLVGFLAVVKPKLDEAGRLARQADDVRSQIDDARRAAVPTKEEAIRVADLFRLSRAMPDRPDVPDVLLQLSQIASETGITFKTFSPGETESLGSYTKLPIQLVFEGNFYDVSDFLYRARNLVDVHAGQLTVNGRLFSIDSLAFGEGDSKFPKVEAQLTIDAYVFGDGVPDAPQPSTGTTAPGADSEGTTPVPASPSGATAASAGVAG